MAVDTGSGISYQPQYDEQGQDVGLTTTRDSSAPETPAPVTSGNVDIDQMRQNQNPVTVQYPSGHVVHFPSEAHANEHAASVWGQLKDEWKKVANWQGLGGPEAAPGTDPIGQSIIDHVGKWSSDVTNALEEAGAELGRKPAEMLSGAKNFQAMMPSPYGQKPSMESLEDTAKREHPNLSGVGESVGKFGGTLLSPENIAIMALMPETEAVPLLHKGLQYAFAAGMTKGVLNGAEQAIRNWPKMTQQQKTAALTSGALQTMLAGLVTIHAVGAEGKPVVPSELKGESGEMTVPGTGKETVGTAKGAEDDTRYFREAKAENPDATMSDWMRIAQEKKFAAKSPMAEVQEQRQKANDLRTQAGQIRRGPKRASLVDQADALNRQADQAEASYREQLMAPGKPPVRPLTDADKAAADVAEVNEKGQKLGVKPIEAIGKPPVIDKAGHPDYNEKGQFLGVKPDVEDIGGKVRAEAPPMPRETGERRARVRTPQEVEDTAYFRKAVGELGQDATNDEIDARIAELKQNRVVPASSANHGLLNLLQGEEGSLRIPFTGNPDQGDLFPGGEPQPAADEERTPIWYSHAIDTIASKVQDGMSGDQVRGILINNGVTPDEMHAGGLNDYLSGKGKVSKAELEQHMQENQIRLHDMNYGHYEADPDMAKQADLHEKLSSAVSAANNLISHDVNEGRSAHHVDSFLMKDEAGQKAALESMTPEARQNMLQYLNTLQAKLDVAQKMTGWEVRPSEDVSEGAEGQNYDVVDADGHTRFTGRLDSVGDYLDEEIQGSDKYKNRSAKYPSWVIGKQWGNQGGLGATDYTEKLMMLPDANKLVKAYRNATGRLDKFEKEQRQKNTDPEKAWYEGMSPEDKSTHIRLEAENIAAREAAEGQIHTHSHWDSEGKNVVAFARYGRLPQFTDKPTMMLHELQSDWNTDLKHSGYIGERDELNNKIADLTIKKQEQSAESNTFAASLREKATATKLQDKVDEFKSRLKAGEELTPAEKDSFRDAQKQVKEILKKNVAPSFTEQDQKDLDSAVARLNFLKENEGKHNVKAPVPNAPLLNNWVEVGAKRMLREMADLGYKRMVWPTGEAAADLYGVHSHVKEIRWNPNTGMVDLVQHNDVVRPQSIEPTVDGLMRGLELPKEQAEKLAKQVETFKEEAKAKNQEIKETPDDEDEEDSDLPTEDQYRDLLYNQANDNYYVDEDTAEPTYELWHDGNLIETYDSSEYTYRQIEKMAREWWAEEHPEHDWDTGEYTGDLDETDEKHPGDLEAPELREEDGQTQYHVRDQEGDIIDTFDSERAADRARGRYVDSDVDDMWGNATPGEDYKPDKPTRVTPKIPESEMPKLSGVDLHFGGKLHRLLYDEMLPRFLTKYLKKWGAKVDKIEVPGAAPPSRKYVGPDVDLDDVKHFKETWDGTWTDNLQEMQTRIVADMQNNHKTFSQAIDDLQEAPHFDPAYAQNMPRAAFTTSLYEKEALNLIVHHFGGKIEKTPGTKKFWQIETTPQMERALKTKPQRISQLAAPKVSNQQQEQTA